MTLNFANDLPSVNFSWSGSADKNDGNATGIVCYGRANVARSVSSLPIRTSNTAANPVDTTFCVIVTGA
jgi:hypothetical protein